MNLRSTIALGAIILLAGGAAGAQCVTFDGIDHCPIGAADLALSSDGSRLFVSDLGAAGNDGVSSRFAEAIRWRADLRILDPAFGQATRFAAVSEGFATSSLSFDQGRDGLDARVKFTGAAGGGSYRVTVLAGGEEVGQSTGTNESTMFIHRFPPIVIPAPEPWPPIIIFKLLAGGGCAWDVSLDRRVEVRVDGAVVGIGDEVRIEEDVAGAGHYPYTGFDAMRIQSSASKVVITDERTLDISNGF